MRIDREEILMVLEEEFGVALSDEEANPIRTPAMLIDLILEKAPRQMRPHVAALVKEIMVHGLGVPEEDYDEDIDLGDSGLG